MPRISSYRRQRLPSTNVGAAPRTMDVRIAEGAIWQGFGEMGKGIQNLADSLFRIKQQKQAMIDKTNLSEANREMDEWKASDTESTKGMATMQEQQDAMDSFSERYDAKAAEIGSKYNTQVSSAFNIGINNDFASSQYRMNASVYPAQRVLAGAGFGRAIASSWQNMPVPESPTYPVWQGKHDAVYAAYSNFMTPKDMESTEIQSLINTPGMLSVAKQRLSVSQALDPFEIATFKSRMVTKENKISAIQEAKINELNKEVVDVLVDDPTNIEVIRNLPTEMKEAWEAKLVERDEFMKNNPGMGDPFINAYDPTVFNAYDTLLDSSSTKVSEVEIINDIGNGLTIADAKFLIDKKRNIERTTKLRSSNPGFARAYQRVIRAAEDGLIKNPEWVEGADVGSEEEKKNRIYISGLLDQLTKKAEEVGFDHVEINKFVDDLLKPHQEMEATTIMERIFGLASYEGIVTHPRKVREAIKSLNPKAQEEWNYNKGKGFFNIRPREFFHRWRSPNKIATPQIGIIYKKWAHGDTARAEKMMLKDEWIIPK